MSDLEAVVTRAIDQASAKLRALSLQLWSNPELGRHEEKAHDALTALLHDFGFHVQRRFPTPTAFLASSSSSSSPSPRPHVAIMCEYDALPNIGHACGHNLIAESAVGAGLAVLAAITHSGLAGRVSVFGTPAEENDGGKLDFIDAGLFADVDAAIMVHPIGGTENMLTTLFNANRNFHVHFEGKASHAASNPWEAVNALDAAVQTYQNVANLRQHILPGCRVAGVITKGGDVANVIPDRTEMLFTLRAANESDMEGLVARWRNCVEAAATATGCRVQLQLKARPYKDMINNWCLADVYERHATAAGVPMRRQFHDSGSTDMGNVSYVVPSIHPQFHINSHNQVHEAAFASDAGTDTAHNLTLLQARILAMTALDVLTDERLRREMWREFEGRRGGAEESK